MTDGEGWNVLEVPAGVLESVVGKLVDVPRIETTETEEKQ